MPTGAIQFSSKRLASLGLTLADVEGLSREEVSRLALSHCPPAQVERKLKITSGKALIALLAISSGIELSAEMEIDAFLDMARTKGLDALWREILGFALPVDRPGWFALLGRAGFPPMVLMDGKIKAREVLAYLVEQASKTNAPPGSDKPRPNNAPADVPGKGMAWQDARAAAEKYCSRKPFPGVNAMARTVNCSPSTMKKAIRNSPKLRARIAEPQISCQSVSARSLNDADVESVEQSREPDPSEAASASTDDPWRRLLQQATPAQREVMNAMTPAERATHNAMTPAERRELMDLIEDDPDQITPRSRPQRQRVRARSRD